MDIPGEIADKHQRVVAYLEAHDLDGVLLSRRCNFSWYTCGAHNYVAHACDVGNSWLLVGREQRRVLTSNIEAPRLGREELAGTGIEIVSFDYFDPAAQAGAFRRAVGSMRLGADAPAPGVDAAKLGGDFDRLRWQLTDAEIVRYRDVAASVVAALETAARAAEPGQTENRLAARVAHELRTRSCLPWVLLVGSDERLEQFRHPLPTDKPVRGCFMVASCAERGGLICAASRLASFGPISDDLARRHEAVVTVDAALILSTRPGATLGEIFAEAQNAYARVGFGDEWKRHHQGGSCGYQPREVKAAPGETTVVLANQPFAWNPSIAGTKSEDTLLCLPDGPDVLGGPSGWPTLPGEWNGQAVDRPAILLR